MTVVNPKSISGINSITTGSGSDDILTIHTNNGTERLRVDSTGTTKIVTGIVTTLTATTGIVTTLTTNTLTANSTTKVGSGVTLSPDGDVFATGVTTSTTFVGALTGNVTGNISGGTVAGSTGTFTGDVSVAGNLAVDSGSNGMIDFGDITTAYGRLYADDSNGVLIGSKSNHNLILRTNNTERVRITTGGDMGLGTNSPESKFAIKGTSGQLDLFSISDTTVPTSGAEYAVAMIKTNTTDKAAAITNYNTYGQGLRIYNNGGAVGRDALVCVQANGTRLTVNENVTVNTGNLVIGTSGKGIDFSATGDGSGASNEYEILDDYEEGDFTPRLGGVTNYSSYNITGNGHYVKVGKVVHVNIQFQNKDLNNSASGRVLIYSLPFAPFITSGNARGVSTNYMSHNVTHASDGVQHSWFIDDTYGSFMGLISKSGVPWTNWDASNFTAASLYLDFQGTYFTAA